jgi:olefin beta-lactone synthetase
MINVIEALGDIAQKYPETIGLKRPYRAVFGTLHYQNKTFQQLDHEVDIWATYLLTQGFTRGQKVLLLLPPGEDLLIAVFAVLRLGAIPIVIDPGMGIKNFIHCAQRTQPDLLLGCFKARIVYCLLQPIVHFKKAIFLSQRLKQRLYKKDFACHLQQEERDNDTAAVLFTSGSTGYPKGAVYTYREFNQQIEALKNTFSIQSGEVDLPLLPVFSLYNPAFGMTTVVPEMNPAHPGALDPKKIVEAILSNNVTHSFGSPRLWTKITNYCEKNDITLPSMKRIFLAGAPVHPSLLKRVQALIPNGEAFTPYGATEALPIAYISAKEVVENTYDLTLAGKGTCVGHPLQGVQIRIIPISNEALSTLPDDLPIGEIGEITVSAPYISKSYLNDTSATAKAKILHEGNIWHRMGDLGYKDEQGRLWFCGRKAERVIGQIQTFYTDCCEAIFNAHKDVSRSALIAFDENGITVPAIVVELKRELSKQQTKSLLQELRELAKNFASTYEISHFCFYKKFPVDVRHNAKIHRLTLMRYFQKHPTKIIKV